MDVNRVFLVRHAHAGDREAWQGPDDLRPLSDKGRRQADGLVAALASERIDRIASSPSLRCVQTVEPLAAARRLALVEDDRLLEGHDPDDTLRWLMGEVTARNLLACTHGDLVPAVLERIEDAGASIQSERRWAKGSTWILDADGNRFVAARYVPAP